jgi:hypothetical protein
LFYVLSVNISSPVVAAGAAPVKSVINLVDLTLLGLPALDGTMPILSASFPSMDKKELKTSFPE